LHLKYLCALIDIVYQYVFEIPIDKGLEKYLLLQLLDERNIGDLIL